MASDQSPVTSHGSRRSITSHDSPVFTWPIRVYYEDTDASGVVYHANYLRWFERARTEWLRAMGFSQERLRTEFNLAFTLADIQVRYVRPARMDDELEVHTHLEQLRRASMRFRQVLKRPGGGEMLSDASVRVACVLATTFGPTALPDGLFDKAK